MPSSNSVHVNTALSTFASAYKPGTMIADELCPPIMVDKRSDTYFQRLRKDVTTALADEIGPNGIVSEADFEVSQATFTVRDYGLKGVVAVTEINNADEPIKPMEMRVQNIMFRLWLAHEMRVAAVLDTNASYGTTLAATAVWSSYTTSDPVKDIQGAIASLAPGADEETELVMGVTLERFQDLSRHPSLLGLRSGGGNLAGVLKPEEVAAQLGLSHIFVSDMQKNTANRGTGVTPVYARVWDGTKARIIRRPKGQPSGPDAMCFAGTFRQKKNGPEGFRVTEWDMPEWGVDGGKGVKVSTSEHAARILQSDMGVILTGVG